MYPEIIAYSAIYLNPQFVYEQFPWSGVLKKLIVTWLIRKISTF
jgi:hypothetical protein